MCASERPVTRPPVLNRALVVGVCFVFVGGIARLVIVAKKPKNINPVQRSQTVSKNKTKNGQQQKIDAILDKISTSGYESLTQEEKDFLFRAGKDN